MDNLMNIGVVYPQIEYGDDPSAIKEYAQIVEHLGYSHILAYDHVLGANPNRSGGWNGPYTYETAFQEPFVLFAFMAGVTKKIEFATGIIILPQRQTALVAKQAATLDVLCHGRLRLGIGLGWNQVEYEALGENFHNRGRRMEEQITVLRELWCKPLVNFKGRWHSIPDAGLKPLPIQRPIPVWFGGHSEPALTRAAKLGDGWMTNYRNAGDAAPVLKFLREKVEKAGRSWDLFGIEARIPYADGNPETWNTLLQDWKAAGVTHVSINTMGSGLTKPAEHLNALQKFAHEVNL
jgi:probable F420-dependent oxidoreductase